MRVSGTTCIVIAIVAAFGAGGCWNRGPARVLPAAIDPRAPAEALRLLDADQDGALDMAEVERAPGLKAALERIDANADRRVTADEIAARIKSWKNSKLGRQVVLVTVTRGGVPLTGAVVTFTPEPFLGGDVPTCTGTTDAAGMADVSAPATGRDAVGGVPPGCYRVRITKVGEKIPSRYNTETVLGREVAADARSVGGGGDTFDLDD